MESDSLLPAGGAVVALERRRADMPHVDDLIEPRPEEIILPSRLLTWLHRSPAGDPRRLNHGSRGKEIGQRDLRRNRCAAVEILQRQRQNSDPFACRIKGLAILHGRLNAVFGNLVESIGQPLQC